MMKKILLGVAALLVLSACSQPQDKWELVWEENFDGDELDTSVWSRCSRGRSDWDNTMSMDERLVYLENGCLVLKGMVNDDLEKDPVPYITGGVWSKDRHAFPATGRVEVRARLHGARGAWPAIWMMPFDHAKYHWPDGGEIDIMERLNSDSIAYQTLHTPYTLKLKGTDHVHGSTGPIDPEDFNIYGVDVYQDSIVMHINGQKTFSYYRDPEKEDEKQYPFINPHHILLDMQLGGQWVGEVNPDDLPVTMEIDWVRSYVGK